MANANCPICGAPVSTTASTFPFCNARCRLLDLGNWLDERYVIPTPKDDDDDDSKIRDSDDGDDPKSSLI